ncbi:MAG: protease modulator HflC [Rickettsiaceae bacterium]|nr:protease modulator HflC [Rickettsiaceae bacterium]
MLRNSQKTIYLLITGLFFVIILFSSIFTVKQNEYCVVFQFGEAIRVIDTPGLKIRIPFIQDLQYFDKRLLYVNVEDKELTASDSKRIIVNAFVRFKIVDPVLYVKTLANSQNSYIRMNKIMESAMRKVIGKSPLISLLSIERSNIMLEIASLVDQEAKKFGIDVIDVRILRADLPTENSLSIYQRMQTQREYEAKKFRAEGREEGARIRSEADKQVRIILAEASMQAQIIKGQGDRDAAEIYNKAYSKDTEFYKFYKKLDVYKNVLTKDDTNFILSPDSEFLKMLNLGK